MANFLHTILFAFLVFGLCNVSIGLAENPEETGGYTEGDIVGVAPSLLKAMTTRAGILDGKFRWPNATIPYHFDARYPRYLQTQFNRATQHISERTCIKFTPRKNEPDYINVISGRGCYSYVGRIGGKQDISLPNGCYRLGTFVHEIIHAIGFHHEQSRTDRDDFVSIKYENIKRGMEFNFDKYGANRISPFGVTYDYGSVMHYSSTAFSKNGRDTIVPKRGNLEIGQRRGMSTVDAEKIKNMYCKNDSRKGHNNVKLF